MIAHITPHSMRGSVAAIPSKSCAHRALICAALADHKTVVCCEQVSRDIEATVSCLAALGAQIHYQAGSFTVQPITAPTQNALLDCGESGSTLRFLLPVAAALGCGARFRMHGRLPERPLEPLWSELCRHGAGLCRTSHDEIVVSGELNAESYHLAADISSQFISGLLFALPIIGGGKIKMETEPESIGYIDLTRETMANFGVLTTLDDNTLTVLPAFYRSPTVADVEGDWSSAAFWLTAGALCGDHVTVTGLSDTSAQADRGVTSALHAIRAGNAKLNAKNIPDLVPILAVFASLTTGKTTICGASRLRLKESDRIASTADMLRALGADVEATDDGFVICGKPALDGGVADSAGDHRIAMSAAIASIGCTGAVTILGAEAVEKSYPTFWQDFAALGGEAEMEEEP